MKSLYLLFYHICILLLKIIYIFNNCWEWYISDILQRGRQWHRWCWLYCARLTACTIQQKYSSEVSGQHSLWWFGQSWHCSNTPWMIWQMSLHLGQHYLGWLDRGLGWRLDLCPIILGSVVLNALTSAKSSLECGNNATIMPNHPWECCPDTSSEVFLSASSCHCLPPVGYLIENWITRLFLSNTWRKTGPF